MKTFREWLAGVFERWARALRGGGQGEEKRGPSPKRGGGQGEEE